jgi:SAM-dependent methyltransferase
MRRGPPVSEVSRDRSPRQPELHLAAAQQARHAEPQTDEPIREQEYADASADSAPVPIRKAIEPAANSGVAQRAGELDALLPADEVDYIERNRAAWERWAPKYIAAALEAWQEDEIRWGIWGVPESELRLLEGVEPGSDVIELGCGTAAISAGLARRGLRPVGVDIARPMLEAAARLEQDFGLRFALLCANAERLHYDDASFDCAISEYGASLWCDPHRWVPEAHRVLRPGGRLIFITNSAFLMACTPADGGPVGEQLVRDYFSSDRVEFPGDEAVEFHATHGDWVRLLGASGFVLEDLIETRPSAHATPRFEFASTEWSRRWPSEDIWVARKVP